MHELQRESAMSSSAVMSLYQVGHAFLDFGFLFRFHSVNWYVRLSKEVSAWQHRPRGLMMSSGLDLDHPIPTGCDHALTFIANADFHEELCVANCGVSGWSEANDMVHVHNSRLAAVRRSLACSTPAAFSRGQKFCALSA
jgi:hypothetical protein